jgi:hypothetical protein
MSRIRQKKAEGRNREMFQAWRAGRKPEQLALDHGLRPMTVMAILKQEKHRMEVSKDPYYWSLRQAQAQIQSPSSVN